MIDLNDVAKSIEVIERPLYQNFDLLLVAQACGTIDLFKIGDGSVILTDLGNFTIQVGTIFKTINTSESTLVFCTDEGLHYAHMQSDLSIVFKPQMVMFQNQLIRTGTLIKPGVIVCADFNKPGYMLVDCKTRQILSLIEETNPANKECLKIEKLPYFDAETLPYILTITATGLNLVNVKARRSYTFKSGKFKDFCFQSYGEYVDPVGRLVFSEVVTDGHY